MPFHLPSSWDPGYALPDNVKDEGLERRAFVTKQMPRGTYDNVATGYGGYAVPQYVKAEGTGQGAIVTKWAPSGTYFGPKLLHNLNARPTANVVGRKRGREVVTFTRHQQQSVADIAAMQGFGDVAAPMIAVQPFPEPYQSYGQRAAALIMSHVAMLPQAQRKVKLKQIMDAIDPTLWSRTAGYTRAYIANGMAAGPALQAALAWAMSAGLLAEIHLTGATGKYPSAPSQLGLAALGAIPSAGAMARPSTGTVATTGASNADPTGVCTSDGKLMYDAVNPPGGGWHVLSAGDPLAPPCTSMSTVASSTIISEKQPIYVGPFPFDVTQPDHGYVTVLTNPNQFSAQFAQWLTAAANGQAQNYYKAGCPGLCDNLPSSNIKCGTASCVPPGPGTVTPPPEWTTAQWAVANPGSTIATGKDSNGNPVHTIAYPAAPPPTSSGMQRALNNGIYTIGSIGPAGTPFAFYTKADWYNAFPGMQIEGSGIPYRTSAGPCEWISLQGFLYSLHSSNWTGDVPSQTSSPADCLAQYPPIGKFVHPVTGHTWGMWTRLVPDDMAAMWADACVTDYGCSYLPMGAWNSSTDRPNGMHMEIAFARIDDVTGSWFTEMVEIVFYIPALIAEGIQAVETAVVDIVQAVGDLACAALQTSGAIPGAAAAGKAAGGAAGAAIGAGGAAIAQAACGGGPAPPAAPATNWTEYLMIGGIGLAAVLMLTRKKKPKTAPTGAK